MNNFTENQQALIKLAIENGKLVNVNTEDAYDSMLDECYEPVNICGHSYDASVALYRTDKIAYEQGELDYIDSQVTDDVWFEYDGKYYDVHEAEMVVEGV